MTALSISRVIVREPVLITSLRDKGVHGVAACAGYAHALILDDQGRVHSAGYNDR
jgi:alpha-tubulin suppressor-like RCC1 family protein